MQVPVVIFPVVGGGWTLEDACALLSDLKVQMQARNPTCLGEVMAHVGTQGVTDVREVEDVLLAHLGLVPDLERPTRPAATAAYLDHRLSARLQTNGMAIAAWLPTHHKTVMQRLGVISWQPWGTDNQIVASVQSLMNECAVTIGREQPSWTENWVADKPRTLSRALSRAFSRALTGVNEPRKRKMSVSIHHAVSRVRHKEETKTTKGFLLIVCAREECGGHARLLQQQFSELLQCEVLIGTDKVDEWRSEVETAIHGTVLLQTKRVLCDPVRLLQLFEATHLGHPLICVNIVGGGYDFAAVKPLLSSLSKELPKTDMATLRSELGVHGHGLGQLKFTLERTVPNQYRCSSTRMLAKRWLMLRSRT